MNPITRKNGVPYLTGTDVATALVHQRYTAGDEDWEIARDLGLTTDHVEFALAYERKRRRRREVKTGEAREKRTNGRSQKRRGYRCEKRIEAALADYGFTRVPLSGALGGKLAGDLRRDDQDRKALHIVECKQRRGGMAMLRRWLAQGGADLLVLDPAAGDEPLAVVELKTLRALLAEAGYGRG
jgi:uncharacterized protein (DUF433 family)